MLLLSIISVRNPSSAIASRSRPTLLSKTAAFLLPLSLAGFFLLTPSASQARSTPAQRAMHQARLAKLRIEDGAWAASARQAIHNARLAQRQAARRARLLQLSSVAQTFSAVATPQAQHQARLAKALAAHAAHLMKLQGQHAAQLAKAQKRLAKAQAGHQARLTATRQKAGLKYAKLHQQHIALTSGNVVEAAYAFRGSRYVMGGTSRSGFDCSGFVRYILSNAGGVDVPRTAVEQFIHGAPIGPDAMQPGDLVFFKNTYKRGISHVGIYAGNGQFIHAANAHKGVRMDTLAEPYYMAHFAGARRVLPAQMRAAAFLGQ